MNYLPLILLLKCSTNGVQNQVYITPQSSPKRHNVVKKLKTTRSGFMRQALREAIENLNIRQLEERHKKVYEQNPVSGDEFSVWESDKDWGEE
jgi:hypothetical protein